MLILNVLLLMLIAFVPFPTRVVAEFARSGADRRDAALLYGLTMTITAIFFIAPVVLRIAPAAASRRGSACRQGHHEKLFAGAPIYGLATLLAFVSATASLILFGLIAIFYALAAALFSRRPRPPRPRPLRETRRCKRRNRAAPSRRTGFVQPLLAPRRCRARRLRRDRDAAPRRPVHGDTRRSVRALPPACRRRFR